MRLDWQVRISLDHVQMGGPSRFFPWELQLGDRESIIHSSQKIEKAASSVLLELYL